MEWVDTDEKFRKELKSLYDDFIEAKKKHWLTSTDFLFYVWLIVNSERRSKDIYYTLRMTQDDIAGEIGVSRQVIYNRLKRLKEARLVEVNYNKIIVHF